MAGWNKLSAVVREEFIQREQEGCNLSGLRGKLEEAGEDEAKLMKLYHNLAALPISKKFPYTEPSEPATKYSQPRLLKHLESSEYPG